MPKLEWQNHVLQERQNINRTAENKSTEQIKGLKIVSLTCLSLMIF